MLRVDNLTKTKYTMIGCKTTNALKVQHCTLLTFLNIGGTSDAPPDTRNSNAVVHALKRHCYPHTGRSVHRWCLSSSLVLSVGICQLGWSFGCCVVRATWGPPPCGRFQLASLTGNKWGSMGSMELRINPTPSRFLTNGIYSLLDTTSLHSIQSRYRP